MTRNTGMIFGILIIFLILFNSMDLLEAGKKSRKRVKRMMRDDCELNYPTDCEEAVKKSNKTGIYIVKNDLVNRDPYYVLCALNFGNPPWTIIQRRIDGKIDFYRNWEDYKYGFGNLNSEFWLGLETVHLLTSRAHHEIIFIMVDTLDRLHFAFYEGFAIGSENEGYVLKYLGRYFGYAGDSFRYHVGQYFSTRDRDHDNSADNCAKRFTGAWWFNACLESNLNGVYAAKRYGKGIEWLRLTENAKLTLKHTIIGIRQVPNRNLTFPAEELERLKNL